MGYSKMALVTGASSGFGLLTCIELAKSGFSVIATMRDVVNANILMEFAKNHGVEKQLTLHPLDVTEEESISQLKELIDKYESIDVLINNAGYAGAGFVEEIPLSEYRSQFETNVFGAIAVTQTVLPIMRKRRAGKIINVSSISGRVGFPGLSPYNASKYALEGWSESLRLEMKEFGVDVVLVEPGSYQTNIWSKGKQVTEKSMNPDSPYYEMMQNIERHLEAEQSNYGDPNDVAKLIVEIAKSDKTKLRYPIGKGVRVMLALKGVLPWNLWERIVLKQLK
ncbi:oxidoreductase [Litchfieldia alkalitelluris]|uniref:oxidoreductase n=1 Tax=Litchfieldia alkalitelluris TaxID=304268 RepID=UPI0009971FFF|nr:oxidoreductase [Litchfieldia alkalitelluris]